MHLFLREGGEVTVNGTQNFTKTRITFNMAMLPKKKKLLKDLNLKISVRV